MSHKPSIFITAFAVSRDMSVCNGDGGVGGGWGDKWTESQHILCVFGDFHHNGSNTFAVCVCVCLWTYFIWCLMMCKRVKLPTDFQYTGANKIAADTFSQD